MDNKMDIFAQFDEATDQEGLQNDIAAAEEGQIEYKEVPEGTYDVSITKMELTVSKESKKPMVSIWFKINDGDYKGSTIFMNQVITLGFQIHNVNELLRSMETSQEVKFHSYQSYSVLLDDIFKEIKDTKAFGLEYGTNSKGYKTFKIISIIDLIADPEELPFS